MKKHTLTHKLFRTYVAWFVVYLLILASVMVGCMAFAVKKNIRETQAQLIKSIDENVQNYFDEMNAFSMELVNSQEFKQTAIRDLPTAYKHKKSTAVLFAKLYKETYKMLPLKCNIGIVVEDEYYIWMGKNYYIDRISNKNVQTYDDFERNERPVIKYLTVNEYLKGTVTGEKENQSFITLSRSTDYINRYLDGRAILEIHVAEEDFVDAMKKLSADENESGLKINLFDSDGNALYKESDKDLSQYVRAENGDKFERQGDFIAVRKVFDDNVTIVYTRDTASYYEKVLTFWGISLGLGFLIIGITFLMTYKISKQISKPIHSMCEHVQQIDMKEGVGFEEVTTDIEEIEILSKSLKEMSEQIQESLQQIIMLKEYEMNAKMLALQAQMQPHFLFNTLTTIASMADAEGNDKIYRICMNLNSMFRYIASEEREGVSMFEEIKHIESYVGIMKERFPESSVEINIPLEMMTCKIPKLSIQPLIENAFKYCDRAKPHIQVKGAIGEDGQWTVEVKDNGEGFSAETKAEIMQKCEEGLNRSKALTNHIGGMGLVNVYVRLKLFYGDKMSYFIEENEGRIVIGGDRK